MMSITSYIFFVFFVFSLLIYYIFPNNLQWIVLLVFSGLFFFLSCTPYTGIYLGACIIITHICANKINLEKVQKKKKKYLLIGIILNSSILVVLKYSNFGLQNINHIISLLGFSFQFNTIMWAVPIGISYYTMQVIAYLVDIYEGIAKPERNLFKTALFIGYYPQLTSGPIAKYSETGIQLNSGHKLNYDLISNGIQRMLWGLFKKLVISARLGILVDTIYSDPILYQGIYIWIAAAAFLLQLYTDFSGCMDIVIGASECYGIVLPENFRNPFFSKSVQEFWQRWHITLGGWLRDYIMYPLLRSDLWRNLSKYIKKKLGKKAAKEIPSYMAMFVVWLMFGLWHGGSWKFILGEGMMCYLCILLGKLLEPTFKKIIEILSINTQCFSWKLFQALRTFVLMMIANMFFRLDSLTETFEVMKAGISCWNPWILFDGSLYELGLSNKNFGVLVISLLVLLVVECITEMQGIGMRQILYKQNLGFRWFILLILFMSIIILGMYGPGYDAGSFIYGVF